jgi:hypothetical protein
MECVILYRNEDGRIGAVRDGDYSIAGFPDLDAAIAYCDNNQLFKSGRVDHQIVELDEL